MVAYGFLRMAPPWRQTHFRHVCVTHRQIESHHPFYGLIEPAAVPQLVQYPLGVAVIVPTIIDVRAPQQGHYRVRCILAVALQIVTGGALYDFSDLGA